MTRHEKKATRLAGKECAINQNHITQFESIPQHHHSRTQLKVRQLETFEVFIKRNLKTSILEQTENTGMLWLLPCNFRSNGSILTIDTTLVDRGSVHVNVMGFHFDTWLCLSVMWLEKGAFLVTDLATEQTRCAFSQKIASVLNIFAK